MPPNIRLLCLRSEHSWQGEEQIDIYDLLPTVIFSILIHGILLVQHSLIIHFFLLIHLIKLQLLLTLLTILVVEHALLIVILPLLIGI